ncbi:MAG TPA: phage tail sheath C-terminal domain-containing protein [Verrucomicrobiae bacterium]
MPITPTYPGVYIEEIPSGVRTIVGVATSIGAFIDCFQRGPIDQAVRITSLADFERDFGGLDRRSQASYAINQFFLNGGTDAYVVRVTTAPLAAAAVVINAGVNTALRITAARRIRGQVVLNPGTWGNFLRVEVDYDTATLPNTSLDPNGILTQGELFNLYISEVELRDGRTSVRQTETFRNLTLRANARNNAEAAINEGSKLVQVDRAGLTALPPAPTAPFRPDATGTLSNVLTLPPVIPPNGAQINLAVDPDGSGAGVINSMLTLNYGGVAPAGADYNFVRQLLEAAIRVAQPNRPLFSDATVALVGGRFHVQLGRRGPDFNPAATATFTNAAAGTVADALRLSVAQGATVRAHQAVFTNGADSAALTEPVLRGVRANKTGLYALEDADLFNILCVPAAADLVAANDMQAFYTAAEAYCEERRSFLIIDIPGATDDLDGMQTWITQNANLRHRNAAVYFPRLRIADPLQQNRLESRGPSGTMAGLFAATDAARGVWKAPAGTEVRLRGAQELDYVLTDRENGVLNPLGVNCARSFPIFGNTAWGARTLDGADQQASEWKYIPIRRLALFLEESLYRGTKWVVFEPNDEPLWAQIRLNVGAFMHNLFRQGAFQGQTPREAYSVKCDAETTTQADRNLGIVNIVVGFAPLKPAEFVIIKIQQIAGQIET